MSNTSNKKGDFSSRLPPKKLQTEVEQVEQPGDKPPSKLSSTTNGGENESPPFPPYQEIISSALLSNHFLRKDAPHQIGPSSGYDRFECIPSIDKELPPLLDWIALFFAIESDDVVATALSESSESTDVTVYIALNKGSETKKHSVAWEKFKAALTHVFGGQTLIAATDCSSYDYVLSSMLSNGWGKATSRIKKLQTVLGNGGATSKQLGRLKGIIETWSSQHKSEGANRASQALEKTKTFLDTVMNIDGGNAIGNTNDETTSLRLNIFKGVINQCRTVTELDYLRNGVVHTSNLWEKHFDDEKSPCQWVKHLVKGDQLFLVEFSYALQRLLDYHVGIEQLLSHGAKSFFGNLCHEDNVHGIQKHLKAIWVTNPSNFKLDNVQRLVWKVGSEDWFLGMPQHLIGVMDILDDKTEVAMSAIRKECAEFWRKGDVIATNMHVEIKLVYYLQHRKIKTKYNIIGTSSPLCIACETYFEGIAYGERPSRRWSVRESSGKFVKDWLCPPTDDDHPVGKDEWARRALSVVHNGVGQYYYIHLKNVVQEAGALDV